MAEEIRHILNNLISDPSQKDLQIDFDLEKKIFVLSIHAYQSRSGIPQSIKEYVAARQGRVFKPHATSFQREGDVVILTQTIPFQWGFRPSIRKDILDFLHLAKRCRRMLYEIALEERCKAALFLDSDVAE